MEDILDYLIEPETKDYKCYEELKTLLQENLEFRNYIIEGIKNHKIYGFSHELWEKIRSQNIRRINNFSDVFKDGANIGYCTVASKQLSYSLETCYICGGVLPIIKGTKNSIDGSHTWISYNNTVIDTTLMLEINEEYSKKIGYIEENRYNPNYDPIYLATKEYTNDKNLQK